MKALLLLPLLASLSHAAPVKKAAPLSPEEKLCRVAYDGSIEQVNAALKKTSKFGHSCEGWGNTALEIAVLNGRSKVVAALLKAGATPKSIGPKNGSIMFLLHDGESAKLLLAAGAEPDVRNEQGSTPLCWMASTRMLLTDNDLDGPKEVAAIFEVLIAAKADINAVCEDGETPLIQAAHGGNQVALKILLAHGADFTRVDKGNRTALTFANHYATGAGSVLAGLGDESGQAARKEIAAALRTAGATR